jgi:predicted amidohydrolase
MRLALATLRHRPDPDEALRAVTEAVLNAAQENARIVCTAEAYLPGLRGVGLTVAAPDANFQARAERAIRETTAKTGVGAIVGIERVTAGKPIISALVVSPDGRLLGHQDKVQLDPAEEGPYARGTGRHIFEIDGVRFGIAICHEGWRYPETVRWAARRGAHIVFHPQFSPEGPPRKDGEWASSAGTIHEQAALCRAAENMIYFATVNYATPNPIAGTALIDPDGNVQACHVTGNEHLLIADIDPTRATGLLAQRLAAAEYS